MGKPILVVMAAGMGSRYGGLKQIEPVGPGGEIILDYSVYDALRAGFERVIFIIKKSIEQDFSTCIAPGMKQKSRLIMLFRSLRQYRRVSRYLRARKTLGHWSGYSGGRRSD